MTLSTEDRVEILDLIARYNQSVDAGDGEGFAACWVDDGLFEGSTQTARGQEELRAIPATLRAQNPHTRHWNNNIVIDGTGDEARTSVYVLVLDVGGSPSIRSSGVYRDTLRRVDGAWKFVHRKVTPDRPRA